MQHAYFIILIVIAKRIIDHVRNVNSRHKSYQRMKEYVLILIISSISQRSDWLIGPFILVFGFITDHILS
ncbi:unnamed protein product [Rotaria sordida]|uniref:Uncharacterized protein n=1 Tax=Rotaria sordida TaxID=392033 RepID=A0A813XH42_9BILA|nr:unnamed protein product [Rotaria sordida]CAF3689494.1 unnamed protein product [Rotaria sordida]CAF4266030.1 unnamed protein product [Rotaria sordida]